MKNQIFISFDEEVVVTEDLNNKKFPKFALTVVGNQPSYKFDWEVASGISVTDHI